MYRGTTQEQLKTPMINPVSLRIESHPSGALIDILCDVNKPDNVRVCLTRDLALILRAELERTLNA